MKNTKGLLMIALSAMVVLGSMMSMGCKKEEPENNNYTDDSLGLEFSDSIIVNFGNLRWATLEYTSHIEHEELLDLNWIFVEAHKPGVTYPAVKMKFFEGKGAHSATMTINDPGLGYTVPGELYGDAWCGYALYYEKGQVTSPDGTKTSDWRPMEITMEVMEYDDSTKQATAYIHGTMFNYGSWYNSWIAGSPIDLDSVETRPFSITFADLTVSR